MRDDTTFASATRIADEARRELEWLERLQRHRNLEVRERIKWIRRYLRLYETTSEMVGRASDFCSRPPGTCFPVLVFEVGPEADNPLNHAGEDTPDGA